MIRKEMIFLGNGNYSKMQNSNWKTSEKYVIWFDKLAYVLRIR